MSEYTRINCGKCGFKLMYCSCTEEELEKFDESKLRSEIVKTWGPAGSHVAIYDMLTKELSKTKSDLEKIHAMIPTLDSIKVRAIEITEDNNRLRSMYAESVCKECKCANNVECNIGIVERNLKLRARNDILDASGTKYFGRLQIAIKTLAEADKAIEGMDIDTTIKYYESMKLEICGDTGFKDPEYEILENFKDAREYLGKRALKKQSLL